MAAPTNREEFKKLCLRRLGWPVININVNDDQVDDRIDQALSKYRTWHYDATVKMYWKHQISADNVANQYIQMPENRRGVIRIFPVSGSAASVNMFDLRYQLRLHELYDFTSTSYVNYAVTMQHIRTLELLFSGLQPIRFNKHTDRLYIDWDWNNDIQVGEYIIIEGLEQLDEETYPDIWSDRWLQNYATALIKLQWGNNMKKYTGVKLPGGVQMDGQTMYNEAIQEIDALHDDVETKYQYPPEFIVG